MYSKNKNDIKNATKGPLELASTNNHKPKHKHIRDINLFLPEIKSDNEIKANMDPKCPIEIGLKDSNLILP